MICGGFFCLGILGAKEEKILVLIFVALLAMVFVLYKKNAFPLLCILFLMAGSFRFKQMELFEERLQRLQDNQDITLKGTLYKAEVKNQKEYIYLKNVTLKDLTTNKQVNSVLIISDRHVNSHIGNLIQVKGRFKKWNTAKNPGAFDEAFYYHALNINGKVMLENYSILDDTVDDLGEWLVKLKKLTANTYEKLCSPDRAAVLCAMILGDTTKLEEDTKSMYQDAGVLHILAISGQHISLIGMTCYKLLRRIKLGFIMSGIMSASIVICYGLLTGSSVSTMRAVFMFLVFMGAQLIGRTFDMLSAIALSSVLMLFENPFLLDQGAFLLSFGAVFMIALMNELKFKEEKEKENSEYEKKKQGISQDTDLVENRKEKPFVKIYTTIKNCLWSSFFIQTGILPIIAFFYYETARYAVFANLIVLFFATWMLQLGVIGGIVGNVYPQIGKIILDACSVFILLTESVCKFFQKLPFEQWIMGKPQLWQIFVYYILFIMFAWSSSLWKRKLLKWIIPAILSVVMSILLCFKIHRGVEITSLYVGQGDGTFIRGPGGKSYFIDGGSSDLKKVGKQQILPFLKSKGIGKIDYWFVSHTDKDHISGIKEILEDKYPIKYLFLPKVGIRNEEYLGLLNLANKTDTKVLFVEKGSNFQESNKIDKKKESILILRCLYPEYENTITEESSNENSVVLSLEYGNIKSLFTGDLGFKGEEELQNINCLSEYQVLKVAHHGSRNSTSDEFLSTIKPKLAIISCGENNSYGHPHQQLLQRLYSAESKVFITSKSGAVCIKISDKKLKGKTKQVKMTVEKFSSH